MARSAAASSSSIGTKVDARNDKGPDCASEPLRRPSYEDLMGYARCVSYGTCSEIQVDAGRTISSGEPFPMQVDVIDCSSGEPRLVFVAPKKPASKQAVD